MIRPGLIPFGPTWTADVHKLFDACAVPYAKQWTFNPHRTLLATRGDSEVVGFVASWWDQQPIAWIDMLLVRPDCRGQGVGAWLCWTIEAILRREGAQVIRCVLDEGAEIAAPLEKAGFSRVGTFLVMEKHYNVA